jgi:hypothetical protein
MASISLMFMYCHVVSDSRRGFGLEIGFVEHFHTRLVTTLNYSAIGDLHTLQITVAHAKSAFSSRFPVTDLNNGHSSTVPTKSSLHILF